eukprot:5117393-Ditylum_brightwellii.AAC.1
MSDAHATYASSFHVAKVLPSLLGQYHTPSLADPPFLHESIIAGLLFDAHDLTNQYDKEVVDLLGYPSSPKAKKKYQHCEKLFYDFCDKRHIEIYNNTVQVANFIHDYVKNHKNAGSIWSIYSAINNMFKCDYDYNLNSDRTLRNHMLSLSKKHIPKKFEIIPAQNMRCLLEFHLDDNGPEELLCKIWTALLYFSLLHNSKLHKL